MSHTRPTTRRQVAVSLGLVLVLAVTWGNFSRVGASDPLRPTDLVTTDTWWTFGTWPWLVIDRSGVCVGWAGATIGFLATVLAVLSAARLWHGKAGETRRTAGN